VTCLVRFVTPIGLRIGYRQIKPLEANVSSTRSSSLLAPRREGYLWIAIFVLMGLCLGVAASLATNPNYDDDEEATSAATPAP
jgi:hypothetical protein